MPRSIQVFEFERLTLHKDAQGRCLTKGELDKLYAFNDCNKNDYFTGIRDGVKFKSYVGVIQIGGLTIEILPKADKNIEADNDFKIWHKVLLDMLKICQRINVHSVSEAHLQQRHHSLLELYFEMYLDEVSRLLRSGLIKQYRKQSGNTPVLKGRLDFNKNIQQNLIHQERFYTTHQVYDHEHLVNQILLKGLSILADFTFNAQLKDKITRLRASFPEIKEIPIQKHHFAQLKENRKTVAYTKALQIARMIILNYSPDIRSGQENMLTLLFDMNTLWEEYIYRMLLRTKRPCIQVNFQNKQKFWENRKIKPDLVITQKVDGEPKTYVIDTKWKMLNVSNPKPSDGDLKQMYVYNLYWNAERSLLLYPSTKRTDEKFGSYWKGRDNPINNQCKVGFVSVLNKHNELDMDIGDEILAKLVLNEA
ncbi:hypothetical protein BKI52_04355 [marine bacterium AO1-C]|nr:hypothetical protein BKI52_04355 [marine bacterium AO1-C]